MKHEFNNPAKIVVEVPAEDLENLVDKITDGVLAIIVVSTLGGIAKSWLSRRNHAL